MECCMSFRFPSISGGDYINVPNVRDRVQVLEVLKLKALLKPIKILI